MTTEMQLTCTDRMTSASGNNPRIALPAGIISWNGSSTLLILKRPSGHLWTSRGCATLPLPAWQRPVTEFNRPLRSTRWNTDQFELAISYEKSTKNCIFPRFNENSCGDLTELNDSSTLLWGIFPLAHFCFGNCNKRTNTNDPFMNLSMITTKNRHTIG